jgi:hypothetical protein
LPASPFKDHLSYLPFNGSVLSQVSDELGGYTTTKARCIFPSIVRRRRSW